MSLPKKRKKDIDIKVRDHYDGPEEWREQFLDQNKQFLPREVDIDDLDKGFIGFIGDDLGIAIEGKEVPVHFLTLQRWKYRGLASCPTVLAAVLRWRLTWPTCRTAMTRR